MYLFAYSLVAVSSLPLLAFLSVAGGGYSPVVMHGPLFFFFFYL